MRYKDDESREDQNANDGGSELASNPNLLNPSDGLYPPTGQIPECDDCMDDSDTALQNQKLEKVSYVYALGKIEIRYPGLSIEKELMQAMENTLTNGLTDQQAIHAVLTKPENRYLLRQLCWIFTIEGIETYLLKPNDPYDYSSLIEALRVSPQMGDIDVVIGQMGPIEMFGMCSGLMLRTVYFDRIYSFDIDSFVKSIPRPKEVKSKDFEATAEELFSKIMQIADNAGSLDDHRALNYLTVRYPAIYLKAMEAHADDFSLDDVSIVPSRLTRHGNPRKIVDVIFSYRNRKMDGIEKHFVRVDVTDEFPFLVTKMQPYYTR